MTPCASSGLIYDTKKRKILILLIISAIAFSFILSMRTLFFPASQRMDFNDSSVYQYIGYLITQGKVPYIDVFDHKGIYLYFINAIGYLINQNHGMWFIIWLFLFICIVFIFCTARRFVNISYSVLITLIVSSGICVCFWDGDNPDFFAAVWSVIAFYVLSDYFKAGVLSKRQFFIVGILFGAGFWLKPNMISGILIIIGCILIHSLFRKKFSFVGRLLLFLILGFITASLPALIWLGSHNALSAMFEDYFLFNMTYTSFYSTWENRLTALSYFLSIPSSYIVLFCILLYLFTLLGKRGAANNGLSNGIMICGVISYVICLILAAIPGNRYQQYATLFYPSTTYILTGTIIKLVSRWENRKKLIMILACITTGIILTFNTVNLINYCNYFWRSRPQEIDEKNYIIEHTNEEDTIAMISPYYTGFYIATERDSATKYAYVQLQHFQGMKEGTSDETEFWNEYAGMLMKACPRMIIIDRDYDNIDSINNILEDCLDHYVYSGESAWLKFYYLPKEYETIPEFHSYEYEKESLYLIPTPSGVIEAYRNGEISLDEAITRFEEEFDKAFGLE